MFIHTLTFLNISKSSPSKSYLAYRIPHLCFIIQSSRTRSSLRMQRVRGPIMLRSLFRSHFVCRKLSLHCLRFHLKAIFRRFENKSFKVLFIPAVLVFSQRIITLTLPHSGDSPQVGLLISAASSMLFFPSPTPPPHHATPHTCPRLGLSVI